MSPWLTLTLYSFIGALPLIYFFNRHSVSFNTLDRRIQQWSQRTGIYAIGLACVTVLYALSISQWASYDEYSYAMGTRSPHLFVGANHFLSHFIAHGAYRFWSMVSTNSLLLRQVLNIVYTLMTLLVLRQIILLRSGGVALANLGSLLFGVSYGIWKYAVSAEVYPLMLLLWVCAVWQGHRILLGRNSWGNFFLLSVFSNMAVLAHDMAALMSVAFVAAFLLASKDIRGTLVFRYLTTGLLLLPLFQGLTVLMTEINTWKGFADRHLYYIVHPDSGAGDYRYGALTNAFVSAREALFSMFTGIDSVWVRYDSFHQGLTVIIHIAILGLLGCLYVWAANYRSTLTEKSCDKALLLLPVLNWTAIFVFTLFWRPNDEIQHWFLPFSVLLMFSRGMAQKPVHSLFALLVLFVSIAGSGVYARPSGKLLMAQRSIPWLKDLPDSPDYVFSATQNALPIQYYRPHVIQTSTPAEQNSHVKNHKMVFVHQGDMDHFDKTRYEFIPWPPYPYFYRVSPKGNK